MGGLIVKSLKVGDTLVNGDVTLTGAIFAINEQTIDFGTVNKTVVLQSTDNIQEGIDMLTAAGGGSLFLKAGDLCFDFIAGIDFEYKDEW